MNVKPGAICRVVGGVPKSEFNKLVQALFLEPRPICCLFHELSYTSRQISAGPTWVVEALQPIVTDFEVIPAGGECVIPAKHLRPLYDGDLPDESLSWAERPQTKEKVNEVLDQPNATAGGRKAARRSKG